MQMKAENQLSAVTASYDRAIELGRRGIDPYRDLPQYITDDPDYAAYRKSMEGEPANSGRKEIVSYLAPEQNVRFVDLGCCLNLMFRGYDEWPSSYYGVDASQKTIQLLNSYVSDRGLHIGALHCGSIHETPFEDGFFDIGACVGVLEYYDKEFVAKAVLEAHRIMKPDGKLVLDIPNLATPACRIMTSIEAFLGRPVEFDLSPSEFEQVVQNNFEIVDRIDGEVMVLYLNLNATRIIATTIGVFLGLFSGVNHGIFEILQGNKPTDGLVINAIGFVADGAGILVHQGVGDLGVSCPR